MVNASVGGKLAQIGSRLIDGVARKMAEDFFSRFNQIVAPAESAASESMTEITGPRMPIWGWVAIGVLVLLLIYMGWSR
jgi:type VI protein secretion system component VasF